MSRGRRKFHFAFERTGLTRFSRLCLLQQFCKLLRLRHFLQRSVRWPNYHHRTYHPADLFLGHVFGLVAGIGRVESTQSLIHNGLLRVAQTVEAGEVPADLLAELQAEFESSRKKPQEQSQADAVQDIAIELQMPIENVEAGLAALEAQPTATRELLLR